MKIIELTKEYIRSLMRTKTGNNVSFSNIKTRRKFKSNVQKTITLKNGKKCRVSPKILKKFKIINYKDIYSANKLIK